MVLRTPVFDAPRSLIVVVDPPLLDDATPAVGMALLQDQQQGCTATPELTTLITGSVSGLASEGGAVGCLQLHDASQVATVFIYVIEGDTIAEYSLEIEPFTTELGHLDFEGGIGSVRPPTGDPFPLPNDLDGDGVDDLFDWVSNTEL